ncbi:MAG: benzoate-CoA ligase family protein [Proteobacteria bacterium]|nr:benzoate-CoA ligase family protein [Pseudomonadota bacterium]
MKKNEVTIDHDCNPYEIKFSPSFNVAVPFIDRHISEGRGDKTAIQTTVGQKVSYKELAENVNRCGNLFKKLDLQHGDRILMVVKDCPEFFYIFWGAIKAGFIPVPVNTILRAKDYKYFIKDSDCSALIYSSEFAAEVEPAATSLSIDSEHCIPIDNKAGSFHSLLKSSSPELKVAPAKASDDCFFLYSSGSTGNPKGAVHCHKDMVIICERMGIGVLKMGEDDIFYSAAKLFFAYGLGNASSFPLWVGGTSILFDLRPTPETVFDTIEQNSPTLFFGVPTLYAGMLKEMTTRDVDFSSVRTCLSAGEGLPLDIYNRWKEKTGLEIINGVGSTEVLQNFVCNPIGRIIPESSGIQVPGYETKLVDARGDRVATGELGELYVKGDSNAVRYWRKPEKTAETMVDGWLRTGDTYYQDEQGYYYFKGRNDDMLKVGGIWCSPFEIESKLIEHPEVLEAAVVGNLDENNLIKPKAFILLKRFESAGDQLKKELQQFCKQNLAPYKYPRWFEFVKELPKTATGKIQRHLLRDSH